MTVSLCGRLSRRVAGSLSGNVASRIKNITGDGCRKSVICSGKNFGIKELLQKQAGRLLDNTARDLEWNGQTLPAGFACKEYAFQVLDFDDVYSIIRDSNVASQNVARRNGMSEVDILIKYYRGVEMPHIVFRASRKNI